MVDRRIGDGDRERLIETLARHAAEGRLSTEELEERAAAVYEARTEAEADAVLADLPPLAAAGGSGSPSRLRRRRYGEHQAADPSWRATEERFRDPSSGRVMRVWVEPGSGVRHYVPEG